MQVSLNVIIAWAMIALPMASAFSLVDDSHCKSTKDTVAGTPINKFDKTNTVLGIPKVQVCTFLTAF